MIVRDGGKERVDSVGAVREWSGERSKLNKGRQRQSCKLRNYGGETTGINTKCKQDHKRNHVLERVGRNVMWRAWRACKQHVGAEAASRNRNRSACANVSESRRHLSARECSLSEAIMTMIFKQSGPNFIIIIITIINNIHIPSHNSEIS